MELELSGQQAPLSEADIGAWEKSKQEYNRLLKIEETSWRQKSRASWLKEGDKNNHFFHKIANMRNITNSIVNMKINGVWVSKDARIRDHIEKFYKKLYTNSFPMRPEIVGIEFAQIKEDQRSWLERPFTKEEVLASLKSMEDDKAPGSNGFPIRFITCWEFMRKDVMTAIHAFHEKYHWCKILRATFIS